MLALRRQLIPAVMLLLLMAVLTGIVYPAATWAVGDVLFPAKANGSFVYRNGQAVGSSIVGQSFSDAKGNPLPQYFQPRPPDPFNSNDNGYDPTSSGASNLGPSDPRLIGFVPGVNTVDLRDNPSATNPFASPADPYCVPLDAKTGTVVTSPSPGETFARTAGAYDCDPATVPERAIAYRKLNGLPASATVPVDAVTASGSGLDPDISPANADLQAQRVATARHLPLSRVLALISAHTDGRALGILGERTVNVLDLNLALDRLT